MSTPLEIQRRLRAYAANYNRWVFSRVAPVIGQRVLDVGSGTGKITEHAMDRELVVALDVSEEFLTEMRREFGDRPQVEVCEGDIEDPAICDLARYDLDSIMCLNTLEHLEHDERALAHMFAVLAPGGTLGLLAPALQGLYGTMDEADNHYRRYGKAELRARVEGAGFLVRRLRFSNFPGIFGWILNGLVLRREMVEPAQYRLYDKLVPLIARAEALLPPLVGLSLVCWAEKPD